MSEERWTRRRKERRKGDTAGEREKMKLYKDDGCERSKTGCNIKM